MATRDVVSEQEARLAALRQAAEVGWADVAAGRFTDLDDDDLEDHIRRLGRRASDVASPD